MKCTQCGSDDVVLNLRVMDQVGEGDKSDLALETHMSPHALFLTEAVSIPVVANVCVACGNVMFSVREGTDLQKIRQAQEALNAVDTSAPLPPVDDGPGFGSFIGGATEED